MHTRIGVLAVLAELLTVIDDGTVSRERGPANIAYLGFDSVTV